MVKVRFNALFVLFVVFAVIVMVWGKLIFGFVLGSVASTIANVEALRVKFEERFFAVQAHMNDQNMPCNLQQRVVNFFQYIWRRNRLVFISFFISFFSNPLLGRLVHVFLVF